MRDEQVRETDSFEELYAVESGRLWRSIVLFVGDQEVASDVVAETFTRAIEHWDSLRDPRAWLWRVAFREAAVELKARARFAELPETPEYHMPEHVVDLLGALSALSVRQRQAIVLRYYGDFTSKEIAELIGSTSAAVGVHLHRGRRKLRELLETHDG